MSVWILMLIAGLLTFGIRLSFILLLERIRVPQWFTKALRFVPVAVLSAIVLPEIAVTGGQLDISLRNPQLLAGAVAILVAWRTRNVLVTIAAGMAALLVIQAILARI